MQSSDESERHLQALLSEQVSYYRVRAPEYDSEAAPEYAAVRRQILEELRPSGDVLELACGTGQWTEELVRHAKSVTGIDASPEALAIARTRVGTEEVRLLEADVFSWKPDRQYDCVFFAFWLSHVPLERFDAFWSLVSRCLRPGGRVLFVDEDNRSDLDDRLEPGVARRTVRDGRRFEIVKVFWSPEELASRLLALGWAVDVEPVHDILLVGRGGRLAG